MERQIYYKHEGGINPAGIISSLLFGTIAAVVGSFIYSYAIAYIPFVYLNFLICIGFSALVGYAVAIGAKKGKIRNANLVFILAVLAGLLAEYAQWVTWLFAYSKQGIWTMSLSEMKFWLSIILEEGAWSFKGTVVTGTPLLIIWLIEGAVIIFFGAFIARSEIAETPFCERCYQWVESKVKLPNIQMIAPVSVIKGQMEAGDFSSLLAAPRSNSGDARYLQVILSRCNSCTSSNFLTLNLVELVKNKNKVTEKKTLMVRNLIINYDIYNLFIDPHYSPMGQQS
ncbi:MAG: hypothetical protein Q8930_02710 [Bacillota bacterium]|nr:hypothetical protein [Bacillota bacterium]